MVAFVISLKMRVVDISWVALGRMCWKEKLLRTRTSERRKNWS